MGTGRKYIVRLDDACEKMDHCKWEALEYLLDKYDIKPLVGVIPNCQDPKMQHYDIDEHFWSKKVQDWKSKGWEIALHGYNHVYVTDKSGINPMNKKSEFAGLPLEKQKLKIIKGLEIFKFYCIDAKVFFAPSHTFDRNTLRALQEVSDIRIISDTIAFDSYRDGGFVYVPQQCSYFRSSPYLLTTFCFHPNTMNFDAISKMETFIKDNISMFTRFPLDDTTRKFGIIDKFFRYVYFKRRNIKLNTGDY